jgi:hypothetical protein
MEAPLEAISMVPAAIITAEAMMSVVPGAAPTAIITAKAAAPNIMVITPTLLYFVSSFYGLDVISLL